MRPLRNCLLSEPSSFSGKSKYGQANSTGPKKAPQDFVWDSFWLLILLAEPIYFIFELSSSFSSALFLPKH